MLAKVVWSSLIAISTKSCSQKDPSSSHPRHLSQAPCGPWMPLLTWASTEGGFLLINTWQTEWRQWGGWGGRRARSSLLVSMQNKQQPSFSICHHDQNQHKHLFNLILKLKLLHLVKKNSLNLWCCILSLCLWTLLYFPFFLNIP